MKWKNKTTMRGNRDFMKLRYRSHEFCRGSTMY